MKKYAVPELLYGEDIKRKRKRLEMTQAELADLVHVSKKTIERWEGSTQPITGPVVPLLTILLHQPELIDAWKVPERCYPLRLIYMWKNDVCTIIDVEERLRKVIIKNYTDDLMKRAFGVVEHPTFEMYEEFLESRCFPRSRDKMKLMLRELDLPFYEPMMIVEKTEGRMAEDHFWLKIERG